MKKVTEKAAAQKNWTCAIKIERGKEREDENFTFDCTRSCTLEEKEGVKWNFIKFCVKLLSPFPFLLASKRHKM